MIQALFIQGFFYV